MSVPRDRKPLSPSRSIKSMSRLASRKTRVKSVTQYPTILVEALKRGNFDDDVVEEEETTIQEAFEPTGNFLLSRYPLRDAANNILGYSGGLSDFRILCLKRGFAYVPPIVQRQDQPPLVPKIEEKLEDLKKTKKAPTKTKQSKRMAMSRGEGSLQFPGKTEMTEETFLRPAAKGKATRMELSVSAHVTPESSFADKPLSIDSVGTATRSMMVMPQIESLKSPVESVATGPGDEFQPPPPISLYSTFTLKDNLEFCRPCIQVIQGIHGDGDIHVTEIYIRAWRIDMDMMSVFQMLWPPMPGLQTVNLWNVGLGAESLDLLASFLPLCTRLTTLVLDGNALEGFALGRLLDPENSVLRHLSLRFCRLTALEAYGISSCLVNPRCLLLTLNMSTNNLGDAGVTFIARALRMNRSLLTLNLTNNKFGDQGATELATALTEFQLDHQQVVERRRLYGLLENKENMEVAARMAQVASKSDTPSGDRRTKKAGPATPAKGAKMTPAGKADATRRANAENKMSMASPKKTGPKGSIYQTSARNSSDDKLQTLIEKPAAERSYSRGSFRTASGMQLIDSARGNRRNSTTRKHKYVDQETTPLDTPKNEPDSPLTDTVRYFEGNLYLLGNRTLISLNLSRNHIGVVGMRLMLTMVEEHLKPHHGSTQAGKGLRRLVLHHNQVPETDPCYKLILKYMRLRDPFFKSPRIDLEKTYIAPCSLPLAF